MKTISIFNNKGGVGKTTLTYHLGHALAAMGHKTLVIDFDPQCNLTILSMDEELLHEIWSKEDEFVDDFERARKKMPPAEFEQLLSSVRSIHFLLKPTEDGTAELSRLSPPQSLAANLDLIPGRLTMHLYEDKIAKLWSEVYQGEPQAIRTVTKIREIAEAYARQYGYEYVIMDTSPSLGALNKVIISTTDGFLIPCMPDMFSLYGIRNIGNALGIWKKQFDTVFQLLSEEKRRSFPEKFVRLLGFTIYNAKRYTSEGKPWNLATAHYNYAMQVPGAIERFILTSVREHMDSATLANPVGGESIMHSHNTFPSMAQKYHMPMWSVPSLATLETDDEKSTVRGNRAKYENTKGAYIAFANDLLTRIDSLD